VIFRVSVPSFFYVQNFIAIAITYAEMLGFFAVFIGCGFFCAREKKNQKGKRGQEFHFGD
jgi:uncharacterized membrane protein YhaH (DUF805 family)